MRNVDWSNYFDGTMHAAQRAAIDADADLCRERDSFREFQDTLRDVGQAERVPVAQLEAKLATVARSAPSVPTPWAVRMIPVIAVLALVAVFVNRPSSSTASLDRLALARTAMAGEIATSDGAEAANWLSSRVGFPVPVVDLQSSGRIMLAGHGKDWGLYTFVMGTDSLALQMARADAFRESDHRSPGSPFYEGTSGIGWRDRGVSYYVTGCELEVLRRNAAVLYEEIRRAKQVQPVKRRTSRGSTPVQQ